MYLSHFGLNEPPFRITPHTDFFFAGANRGATLEALLYAITHDEGIVKVSGEVGSGKTMLSRVLMERLPPEVETIYLANPSLSREEILYAIADELKLELSAERTTRLLKELQDHLIKLYSSGRRVVVLIDEAHAMPKETLEEVRLLSNLESGRHKLLQIVLFGQPELDQQLNAADMRQLKERITHSFRLEPLVRDDIASYIDFRMRAAGYRGPNVFSSGATRLITTASEGLTRRVNILADKSLLAAFAHNTYGVSDKEAKAAIRDSDFFKQQTSWGRLRLTTLGVAAGLAAGIAAGWFAQRSTFESHVDLRPPASAVAATGPSGPNTQTPAGASVAAGSDLAQGKSAPSATPATVPATHSSQSNPGDSGGRTLATASPTPPTRTQPHAERAVGAIRETRQNPDTIPTSSASSESPAASTKGMRQGKLFKARYDATQEWLQATPGNIQSIQLLTVKEEQLPRMERFLHRASALVLAEKLHVYSVKIDGHQHFRAAYGEFQDATQARAALNELPAPLKSQNPYIRSVARMQSQNRQ